MDVVQDFLAERVFDQLSASPKKMLATVNTKHLTAVSW